MIFYRTKNKKICYKVWIFIISKKIWKTIIRYRTCKKVVHKTGEFIGNKISDAVTKSNDYNVEKQEPVEEVIIPPAKRDEILNEMRYLTIQPWQSLWQKNGSK